MDCSIAVAIPTTLDMDTFFNSPDTFTMEDDQTIHSPSLPSIDTFIHYEGQAHDLSTSYDSSISSMESGGEDDRIYTELKPPATHSKSLTKVNPFDDPFGEESVNMDSWMYKHPEEWQGREILDWIYTWLPRLDSSGDSDCRGENFSSMTGRELTNMSETEFCSLEPNYGSTFYLMLHKLLKESQFVPLQDFSPDLSTEEIKRIIDGETIAAFQDCKKDPTFVTYDYDPDGLREFRFIKSEGRNDDGYESNSSSEFPHVPTTVFQCDTQDHTFDATLPYQLPGNRADAVNHQLQWTQQQFNKNKQCPGRPRVRVPSDCSSDGEVTSPPPKKRGRRLGQVSNKGNHLWEFIRDLLLDHNTNPTLIRWEDEDNGIFRIVHSKKVSDLWGKKKNNPVMNYEKLSRAMRHYYKSEILDAVLGRRLVYRFGKNSTGWQKPSTIKR